MKVFSFTLRFNLRAHENPLPDATTGLRKSYSAGAGRRAIADDGG